MYTEIISLSRLTTTFCRYSTCLSSHQPTGFSSPYFAAVVGCKWRSAMPVHKFSSETPSTVGRHAFGLFPARRILNATPGLGALLTRICISAAQREAPRFACMCQESYSCNPLLLHLSNVIRDDGQDWFAEYCLACWLRDLSKPCR